MCYEESTRDLNGILSQAVLSMERGRLTTGMLIVLDLFLKFLGAVVFSFVLWRKLKEDYSHDLIFSFTILVLALALFGDILSQNFLPGLSFWSVLFFQLLCVSFFVKKGYFKFYELIDGLAISWITFFVFVDILSFYVLSGFITLLIYMTILKRYRRFSWYPSGRIGFLGLSVSSLYFLLRGLVAILTYSVLPFFGVWGLHEWSIIRIVDAILSMFLFGVFAFWIYVRSGRTRARRIVGGLSELGEVVKKIFIWR